MLHWTARSVIPKTFQPRSIGMGPSTVIVRTATPATTKPMLKTIGRLPWMRCAPIVTGMQITESSKFTNGRWDSVFLQIIFTYFMLTLFLTSSGCSVSRNKHFLNPDESALPKLSEGIKAFQSGDLEKSRFIFNKIIGGRRGPSEIEESQWYLAQIAEKQGKRAEARQQYLFFSKNFPSSRHLGEVKKRLSALSRKPASAPNPVASTPISVTAPARSFRRRQETSRYGRFTGGLTTEYLYDIQTSPKPSSNVQNRLSEFLDLRWKKSMRGDLKVYLSGMYSQDFLFSDNSRYRLSKFFAEWNDSRSILDFRLGRQPASGNTLFSRFDGVALSVRPFSVIGLNSSVGFPVDTFNKNRIRIQHDRLFYESYISFYDLYHLGGKMYYTQEFNSGFSTRKAVGMNTYWLNEPVNISSIVDYDLGFRKFNDEMLSFEYRYSIALYSVAAEYRKNPFLDFNTALYDLSLSAADPPLTSLDTLRQTFTRDEIQSLALDNTTDSLELRLGTTIDFTKVWRGDFRYSHMLSDVIEFPDGKTHKMADRYSVFFSERNGLGWSEAWTVLFIYQTATDYKTETATSTISKYWGVGTQASLRFRWEHLQYIAFASQSTRMIPGFILNYTFSGGVSAGLEADYSIDKNSTSLDTVKTVETRTSITIPF